MSRPCYTSKNGPDVCSRLTANKAIIKPMINEIS